MESTPEISIWLDVRILFAILLLRELNIAKPLVALTRMFKVSDNTFNSGFRKVQRLWLRSGKFDVRQQRHLLRISRGRLLFFERQLILHQH